MAITEEIIGRTDYDDYVPWCEVIVMDICYHDWEIVKKKEGFLVLKCRKCSKELLFAAGG